MAIKKKIVSNSILLFSIFPALLIITSCSNKGIGKEAEQTDRDIVPGQIISIDVKDNALVGEAVIIKVSFSGGTDGCARPSHLRVVRNNFQISIQPFYSYPKAPSTCTMVVPRHVLTHEFSPHKKGIYIIQASNNKNVAATIKVE